MFMIYNLYKQRGETPLERIQRFAKMTPELKGQKMTYLGRLDPLAEGVLLMASGLDVKRKEEFLNLDKEYDFVSIFGFATDTYDILGKIVRIEKLKDLSDIEVRKAVLIYEGERDQKYPEYSSKMISKKKILPKKEKKSSREQLSDRDWREREEIFQQKNTPVVRENLFSPLLDDVPTKKITIHKINFHGLDALNSKELFGRLLMDISKVQGDFRQHEILTLWKEMLFKNVRADKVFLGRFSAHVSSGTYIRGLVNDFGNTLSCGATTLSIRRTRVGDYKIGDSIK
jgi:tRNA U55 pseudouridine synthase TruB